MDAHKPVDDGARHSPDLVFVTPRLYQVFQLPVRILWLVGYATCFASMVLWSVVMPALIVKTALIAIGAVCGVIGVWGFVTVPLRYPKVIRIGRDTISFGGLESSSREAVRIVSVKPETPWLHESMQWYWVIVSIRGRRYKFIIPPFIDKCSLLVSELRRMLGERRQTDS